LDIEAWLDQPHFRLHSFYYLSSAAMVWAGNETKASSPFVERAGDAAVEAATEAVESLD